MLTISTWMHASRIIRWYLLTEPDIAKRGGYLAEAMNASEGLYLPAMKVALEFDSKKEGRPQSERMLDDASAEALKQICVENIRGAAASGKLANHRHLGTLLGIWAEWAGPNEPRTWVDKLIQSRAGLVTFLESMTVKSTSYGSGEHGPREAWYIQLPAIERFIDLKVIEDRFEKLNPQGQNESETRAIRAFRQALDRRRSGKPDGRPFLDWQA